MLICWYYNTTLTEKKNKASQHGLMDPWETKWEILQLSIMALRKIALSRLSVIDQKPHFCWKCLSMKAEKTNSCCWTRASKFYSKDRAMKSLWFLRSPCIFNNLSGMRVKQILMFSPGSPPFPSVMMAEHFVV